MTIRSYRTVFGSRIRPERGNTGHRWDYHECTRFGIEHTSTKHDLCFDCRSILSYKPKGKK